MLNHVESDSLGKRTALANSYNITLTNVGERRGAVDRHISVLLSKTTVLGEVLQVISSDNQGSLHFVGDNHSLQDTTSDRDIASEWALLVNVRSLDGRLRGLEAKANALVISHTLYIVLAKHWQHKDDWYLSGLAAKNSLPSDEDSILLLISLLRLKYRTLMNNVNKN